jgi:hypothetical protein
MQKRGLYYKLAQQVVIPAKAGIHAWSSAMAEKWIPAFAGMTIKDGPEYLLIRHSASGEK